MQRPRSARPFFVAIGVIMRRVLPVTGLGLLLIITYMAYVPGLHGPWLLDDAVNIRSAELQDVTWDEIKANIFNTERFAGFARSIGTLTFSLSEYVYSDDTYPYKQHNLLLHLINGLLIFWLVRLLFRLSEQYSPEAQNWAALAVTAIWLLHPLQVSTVLYVVQRYVLLATFFSLIALCLYIEGRTVADRRPASGTGLMVLGLGLFWPLGLLSKETAALLVLILIALEFFLLRLRTNTARERQYLRIVLAVFVAIPILVALVYFFKQFEFLTSGYDGRSFTIYERLLTQLHVLWFYVGLIIFPVPANMSLFHDGFPVQRGWDMPTAVYFIALLFWLGTAYHLRRRAPLIGFGLIWFLCWHLLEGTILALELVFEHRNYLALMGLALAFVAAAQIVLNHQKLRVMAFVSAAALVALLGLNTAARAFAWSDLALMIESEYAENRSSPRVVEGMAVIALNRGDHQEAMRYIKELQQLVPAQAYPVLREASLLCRLGKSAAQPFARALILAEQGRLAPGTTNMARSVLKQVFDKGCLGITEDDVVRLTESLVRNEQVHTINTHLAALSINMLAHMRHQNYVKARASAKQLLRETHKQSPAEFANALSVIGDAASLFETPEEGVEFVTEVTAAFGDVIAERGLTIRLPISKAATAARPNARQKPWTGQEGTAQASE